MELLVALSVVGLLAALVFDVAGRALKSSRNAECVSNLRSIVTASHLQVMDHNLVFPDRGDHYLNYGVVADGLLPYLSESLRVFRCPANELSSPLPNQEIPSKPGEYCAYEFNAKLATFHEGATLIERHVRGIVEPSLVAYVYDRPYWRSPERPHRDGANVGFWDGRVEFLNDERLAYEGAEEKKFYNLGHLY